MKKTIKLLISVMFISMPMLASGETVAQPPQTSTQMPDSTSQPEPSVFTRTLRHDAIEVYKSLFSALENNGYFVVFETNIGKNLSRFAQRWGDDYNRNKLDSIRSMIFCNGWYANQMGNHDPTMLALCPLHITVIDKQGVTSILFVRPSQVAKNSPALKVAEELEQDVVRIINAIP